MAFINKIKIGTTSYNINLNDQSIGEGLIKNKDGKLECLWGNGMMFNGFYGISISYDNKFFECDNNNNTFYVLGSNVVDSNNALNTIGTNDINNNTFAIELSLNVGNTLNFDQDGALTINYN